MRFKVAILTGSFTAVFAQMSINCYPVGAGPGGANDCSQFINNFCDAVSDEIIMSTESSGHCYNLANGKRCEFMAFNSRDESGPPSATSCRQILGNVTSQCELGGYGRPEVTGYTFIIDASSSRCG